CSAKCEGRHIARVLDGYVRCVESALEFAREEVVPRLRGMLHAYAFWFALAAATGLIIVAPDSRARVGAAIYGVGLCALFGASATYHRWHGNPRWKQIGRAHV